MVDGLHLLQTYPPRVEFSLLSSLFAALHLGLIRSQEYFSSFTFLSFNPGILTFCEQTGWWLLQGPIWFSLEQQRKLETAFIFKFIIRVRPSLFSFLQHNSKTMIKTFLWRCLLIIFYGKQEIYECFPCNFPCWPMKTRIPLSKGYLMMPPKKRKPLTRTTMLHLEQ